MRLTRDEILLITIILLALTVGAVVKRYREAHPSAAPSVNQKSGKPENVGRSD
jgi:hypothetical protein